jgi:cytochrome c556
MKNKEPEEKFKPSPFNYCDYRCDRCDEKDRCRVYKDDQERLLNHYVKGEDPYDPEIFYNDLKEIFEKTKEMITKVAKEQGIDVDETPDEEMPRVNPKEYEVYNLAYQYFQEAHDFIKGLEKTEIPETIVEEYEDFVWHHTLIAAKAGRLVSGFNNDFLDEEARMMEEEGTLKVINKGISLSKNALEVMLNELPDHLHAIAGLLELIKRLEKQIQLDIRQKVDLPTN